MDSDQLHHHQDIMSSQTLESILDCSQKSGQEKKPRPADMQAQKCPRCDSSNTKFCYYNNYSLSQPRYFCKSCRRYWTKGGTLRNVPVGGGCRKNKRPSSSSSSASSKRIQDQSLPIPSPFVNPLSSFDSITRFQKPFGSDDNDNFSIWGSYPVAQDRYGLGLGAFLDSHSHSPSQNLYYGNENQLGVGGNENTMIPYEEVKQESSRVLWGFPWQGGDVNVGESWNGNGIVSTNWHGLLNSPLM